MDSRADKIKTVYFRSPVVQWAPETLIRKKSEEFPGLLV